MSRVTQVDESCRTYDMPGSDDQVVTKAITKDRHIDQSCHTYESVKSHIWMSRFTRMICLDLIIMS